MSVRGLIFLIVTALFTLQVSPALADSRWWRGGHGNILFNHQHTRITAELVNGATLRLHVHFSNGNRFAGFPASAHVFAYDARNQLLEQVRFSANVRATGFRETQTSDRRVEWSFSENQLARLHACTTDHRSGATILPRHELPAYAPVDLPFSRCSDMEPFVPEPPRPVYLLPHYDGGRPQISPYLELRPDAY